MNAGPDWRGGNDGERCRHGENQVGGGINRLQVPDGGM
jgi:hypothetical protein